MTVLVNNVYLSYQWFIATQPHVFKIIIHHILEELPHQVENQALKEFCKTCFEERRNIRGTDARLYLVQLALLLENMIYQRER